MTVHVGNAKLVIANMGSLGTVSRVILVILISCMCCSLACAMHMHVRTSTLTPVLPTWLYSMYS